MKKINFAKSDGRHFRTDNFQRFLKDIDSKMLSEEESIQLFREYQHADTKRKNEIRDVLYSHNALLVVTIARKLANSPEEMEDLIQEGSVGLLNAIDRFDPEYSGNMVTFSTFASAYIRKETNNYYKINKLVKKTNEEKTHNLKKKIISDFQQREHRNPVEEEIMEIYNKLVTQNKIKNTSDLFQVQYHNIDDIESWNDDSYINASEVAKYRDEADVYNENNDLTGYNDQKFFTEALLNQLSDVDREIVSMRMGINRPFPESFDSIAEKFNYSQQRISQRYNAAIKSMQKYAYALQNAKH